MNFMKKASMILVCVLFGSVVWAGDEPEPKLTIKYSGGEYTLQVGDTIHLGYGSNPYGSFMYLETGTSHASLGKEMAGKTAVITKVKYQKFEKNFLVNFRQGKGISMYLFFTTGFEQAVHQKEIVGINSIRFGDE
jgi:hypothetical protein